MSTDQIIIFSLLAALFALFVWGRLRFDVSAFLILLTAALLGVVPMEEMFLGFAHPATVTVAAVLILSRALSTSGATDIIANWVMPMSKKTSTHVGALSSLGAAMSSFMNNVGALGLLMPVALMSAARAKRSASLILMPLSFGSILGGLITLIGTPPNIIIAAYRGEVADAPFSMFDFTPVGGAVTVAGVLFIATVGWRLIPKRKSAEAPMHEFFQIDEYVTEAKISGKSPAIGKTLPEIEAMAKDMDAVAVAMIRGGKHFASIPRREVFQAGDVLIIEASPEELDKFISLMKLEISGTDGAKSKLLTSEDIVLMEAVVTPGARIEGRTVEQLRLRHRHGVNLLAVSRQGRPYRGRLRAFRFRAGDVLLLHGDQEHIPELISRLGCLPLAKRELQFGKRAHAGLAAAIFAVAIGSAALGVVPVTVAFGLAAVAMVITNILPARDLYEGVDWPVIILLGSLIPIGRAMETTGGTEIIADAMVAISVGAPTVLILTVLLIITMTLSDILNNAATAVVMAPIAFSIAGQLGVSADPFLMAVAVGASCAFLTPIGHQNNALVMGPGGYAFGDYWRMGLPLEMLIVIVAVPTITLVWPF
ncbi:MAG: SLC13 family permease [Rhodospirillales bacterium]|nr:SLC13 family permease [Rhodospirillales bacterium]